jgi:hypothetical protein
MTYVRVTEQDDVILSAKLVEYCEMQRPVKPGMFRTWGGLAVAVIGWAFFGWLVWCVVARVWR